MIPLAVVLVPLAAELPRRARYAATRRATAQALRASAGLAGAPDNLPCAAWPREENGAPAPVAGWHASQADTTGLLVALVAPCPVGVDVEWLARPRWQAARAHFAERGELELLGGDDRAHVLHLWTAKEALLKLARCGLADLGRCSLVERRSAEELVLSHGGAEHVVRVLEHGEHCIAVASAEPCTLALHVAALEPLTVSLLAGTDAPVVEVAP